MALLLVPLILSLPIDVYGYNNGVGMKPPMGWSSWCTDGFCNLVGKDICNEKLVQSIADSFVAQGMDKLGYEYVTLDDCWSSTTRDDLGSLQADPKKFPNGLKPVADYVHSKGLKFGVYTCVGTETCKGDRPGSFDHWTADATTLAGWGIDFVKMDHCTANKTIPDRQLYGNMSAALNATGRPVLFSLCNWGEQQVCEWGHDVAQMFRVQMDHLPFWSFGSNSSSSGVGFGQGTADIIEFVAALQPSRWVKQYGWLDPDFLMTLYPVTMGFTESRTEYTFWSLWSSPLIVSTDIRELSTKKRAILMNPEVIAVNQDDRIGAGDRVAGKASGPQIWSRPLANGDTAVVLYNAGKDPVEIAASWAMVGVPAGAHRVRDLWAQADLGTFAAGYTATVSPRDVRFLRVSTAVPALPSQPPAAAIPSHDE